MDCQTVPRLAGVDLILDYVRIRAGSPGGVDCRVRGNVPDRELAVSEGYACPAPGLEGLAVGAAGGGAFGAPGGGAGAAGTKVPEHLSAVARGDPGRYVGVDEPAG